MICFTAKQFSSDFKLLRVGQLGIWKKHPCRYLDPKGDGSECNAGKKNRLWLSIVVSSLSLSILWMVSTSMWISLSTWFTSMAHGAWDHEISPVPSRSVPSVATAPSPAPKPPLSQEMKQWFMTASIDSLPAASVARRWGARTKSWDRERSSHWIPRF